MTTIIMVTAMSHRSTYHYMSQHHSKGVGTVIAVGYLSHAAVLSQQGYLNYAISAMLSQLLLS